MKSEQLTIPTNHGNLTVPEVFDVLMWGSYKSNRDAGASHEILIKWDIGNEQMRDRYEAALN